MWDTEEYAVSLHAVLCTATMKNVSCSPGEENWRRKIISVTEVGGVVVRQGCVQQYRAVHHCVWQRGKDMERRAWKKVKKSLMSFVCTTQVRSFMADSQQSGLRYRIAIQSVGPGLLQLMVLLSPSYTFFFFFLRQWKRPPWIWVPASFFFIVFKKHITVCLVLQGNRMRNTQKRNLLLAQMKLVWVLISLESQNT